MHGYLCNFEKGPVMVVQSKTLERNRKWKAKHWREKRNWKAKHWREKENGKQNTGEKKKMESLTLERNKESQNGFK